MGRGEDGRGNKKLTALALLIIKPLEPHSVRIQTLPKGLPIPKLAIFFCKWPEVNISGFAGHAISVATTQLCLCGTKAATDST